MSQSLSNIVVHLVFSTKNREFFILDDVRDELHGIIGGIVKRHNGLLLKAGSVSDHLHLLIIHPRTCSPSDLVKEIKTRTSKWMKRYSFKYENFHWQKGYGMFSICPTQIDTVIKYIENQNEHHQHEKFKVEYRRMLKMYNIQWDENYVWN